MYIFTQYSALTYFCINSMLPNPIYILILYIRHTFLLMFCLSVLFVTFFLFLSILISELHHLITFLNSLYYISACDFRPLATLILPFLFLLYILISVIWIVLEQYQLYTYQNFYTFSCCLFWFNSSHFISNHIFELWNMVVILDNGTI